MGHLDTQSFELKSEKVPSKDGHKSVHILFAGFPTQSVGQLAGAKQTLL